MKGGSGTDVWRERYAARIAALPWLRCCGNATVPGRVDVATALCLERSQCFRYQGDKGNKIEGFQSMSKSTIATLIATAFVAIVLAVPSKADEPGSTEIKKHHTKHHAPAVQYAAVPANPYGLPASYYPAPPFPFFLVPGPWWLPAHP
jgi:hypothetical protein